MTYWENIFFGKMDFGKKNSLGILFWEKCTPIKITFHFYSVGEKVVNKECHFTHSLWKKNFCHAKQHEFFLKNIKCIIYFKTMVVYRFVSLSLSFCKSFPMWVVELAMVLRYKEMYYNFVNYYSQGATDNWCRDKIKER